MQESQKSTLPCNTQWSILTKMVWWLTEGQKQQYQIGGLMDWVLGMAGLNGPTDPTCPDKPINLKLSMIQ
jgi:hypothetical protein